MGIIKNLLMGGFCIWLAIQIANHKDEPIQPTHYGPPLAPVYTPPPKVITPPAPTTTPYRSPFYGQTLV